MSQHQKARWQTVGPHWTSVRPSPAGSISSSPVVHHGFHSSYLNAISRPDLPSTSWDKDSSDTLSPQRRSPSSPDPSSTTTTTSSTPPTSSATTGPSGLPPQYHEHHRQQQLYLQQLELMQKLQTMPGSTTRLWYPTFGPTVTTTCSDNTIQLDNPHQYALSNSARLNRQAVGPHWRSIQPYSPSSSSLPTSPQLSNQPMTSASNSPSPMLALYASAASINQVRAASFCLHDDYADQAMSEGVASAAARQSGGGTTSAAAAASAATVQANYITGHYAGAVRYPSRTSDPHQYSHSHPHPTYPYYINTTAIHRDRHDSAGMSRSTSQTSNSSMESVSTALTSAGRSDMKRKAPWQDEDAYRDGSVSEEQEEPGHEHEQELQDEEGGGGQGAPPLSKSVTQFVPATLDGDGATRASVTISSSPPHQLDQDTDMTSAPLANEDSSLPSAAYATAVSNHVFPNGSCVQSSSYPRGNGSRTLRMSLDLKEKGGELGKLNVRLTQERSLISAMDQDSADHIQQHTHHLPSLDLDRHISVDFPADYDQSPSRPMAQPRRTRIRRESDESDLVAEARRQSGEVIRDIFQECFYNAAASSSR